MKQNVAAGRIVEGGSTITQQLVRNSLLTPDRSLTRKVLEILLAFLIEKHYSKREILLLYNHLVYLGPGIRGFQAASRLVYRRPLASLDIVSLCGLVGLLRQPTRTYPLHGHKAFVQRQALLARRCNGHAEANHRAVTLPVSSKPPNPIRLVGLEKARWTRAVAQVCGAQGLSRDDIARVGLTIDRVLQARVDHLLRRVSRAPDLERIAAVVLCNRSGEVLAESAWTQGRDCDLSPTFSGTLQPGSTFKPFALLAALEDGFSSDLALLSAPFESLSIKHADGSPWRVRNYALQYRGLLSVREALKFSDNAVFARLAEILSLARLSATYERFRLTDGRSATPAIALGAVEGGLPLIRLASAYSAIARNGVYLESRFVRFIQYRDGSIWWPRGSTHDEVLVSNSDATARLRAILAEAIPQLVASGLAGKTGTTRTGSLVAVYDDAVSVAIWLSHRSPRSEYDTKSVSALKVVERMIAEGILGHRRDPFSI